MARFAAAASVLAALALAAGCTESDAEPPASLVPISSVTEIAPSSGGGMLSVVVDDFRGCPTAFVVSAEETTAEVRLTATAYRGQHRECDELPTVALERPVGSRRIVDTASGHSATGGTGEELKDLCAGQDPCFALTEGVPQGRTFLIAPPGGGKQLKVYVSDPD